MNNIAEGFGRYSSKDALRFFDIAKASGNEVKSMLYLFEDIQYLSPKQLNELHQQVDNAVKLTGGFIRHLSKSV